MRRAALAAAGPCGRCHSVGIYFEDVALPLTSMYMQGVTLSTGRPDVRPSIPEVLALLADGTVDPVPVFSDVVSFDDAPTALVQGLRKPVVVRGEYWGCCTRAGTARRRRVRGHFSEGWQRARPPTNTSEIFPGPRELRRLLTRSARR